MKRVLTFALIAAAFFALSHRPALAMVEFCPAKLSFDHVDDRSAVVRRQSGSEQDPSGGTVTFSTFGLVLNAYGPRTLTSATLAFDTTAGWFTATLPDITFTKKDRHYRGPSANYIRHDWVSPVMYVRFPAALTISHAWLYQTNVKDDPMFGWDSEGTVMCPPPPAPSPEQLKNHGRPRMLDTKYGLDPQDEDRLTVQPGPASIIMRAATSNALGKVDCAEPFRDAEVSAQARPDYPNIMRETFSGEASSSVAVAIQPDGALRDEWIWGPSGFDAFDDSAMKAARTSAYNGARAYCQPVPSTYVFRVTFDSN